MDDLDGHKAPRLDDVHLMVLKELAQELSSIISKGYWRIDDVSNH